MHPFPVQLRQVFIFKGDAALGRFMKGKDRFHQAGFSASALAHHSDRLAMLHVEGDAIYRLHIAGMTKPKAFEFKPDVQIVKGKKNFTIRVHFDVFRRGSYCHNHVLLTRV